jgi:hypothetical protein
MVINLVEERQSERNPASVLPDQLSPDKLFS